MRRIWVVICVLAVAVVLINVFPQQPVEETKALEEPTKEAVVEKVAVVKETVIVRETATAVAAAKMEPTTKAPGQSQSLKIEIVGITPAEAKTCGLNLAFYKGKQLLTEVPLGELKQSLPFESVTALTVRRKYPSEGCKFAPVNFDSGDFVPVTGKMITLSFAPCKDGGNCPFN